ncbi:hypothetical protein [Thiomicrorhabdus sediminis]|uniref:Uncharacterized protein n=1 Tax=Thiomicrorhabdus sediminis TaxID=2580412 RepID=A0A4P9K4X1_9GAMM|nr:hypothetical protein [Thiomicrorhabdus sediminis]QCU90054.1 hypothetical protein FE785_05105 [Thiomicrorhabdus sediminis]
MIQTFDDLHQLIQSQIEKYKAEDAEASIKFEIADNGSCTMYNNSNGSKFKFMLAKFGDEYKVGFAMFDGQQPSPIWIDDVLSGNFDENFAYTLIKDHLMAPPEPSYW